MDSVDEKYLHQLYYNPKHSTAFSSISKLWQYVRLHGRNITKKQLYEWLSKQDVFFVRVDCSLKPLDLMLEKNLLKRM